ncbi:MAG TPA: hypothetical protein VK973_08850, partial [Arenicellales bacterium]|nr:hypothetical protein [Arenicellales bacterium]
MIMVAVPAGAQQSSLQPVQQLPARTLDLQVHKPAASDDTQQPPPVMTHLPATQKDNPPEPKTTEKTKPDGADDRAHSAPADSA